MYTFEQTKAGYGHLWDVIKITSPKAEATAQRVFAHKADLIPVEAATGVPWYMVGAMLYREADLDFGAYLGNGQSLKRVTTVVPIGRGPFPSFMAGAVDALKLEGMTGMLPQAWTIERVLYWIERFNGQGYFSHGNSPYLWNWTDQYHGGKFIADHVYSATTWDVQGGCAAIIKELVVIDKSIIVRRENAPLILKEQVPMTTPTLPSGFAFPASLSTIVSVATGAAEFLPASIKPLVLIPLDLMKIPGEIQTSPPDATHIAGIVIKHLRAVADDLAAAFPQPPAT